MKGRENGRKKEKYNQSRSMDLRILVQFSSWFWYLPVPSFNAYSADKYFNFHRTKPRTFHADLTVSRTNAKAEEARRPTIDGPRSLTSESGSRLKGRDWPQRPRPSVCLSLAAFCDAKRRRSVAATRGLRSFLLCPDVTTKL